MPVGDTGTNVMQIIMVYIQVKQLGYSCTDY